MRYEDKDSLKFSICNKIISRGVEGSSSHRYMLEGVANCKPDSVNCGSYSSSDTVGISVNGLRKNRIGVDTMELDKAIAAKVTFVTDNLYHTKRSYNIGERAVADYLYRRGYIRCTDGPVRSIWSYYPEGI